MTIVSESVDDLYRRFGPLYRLLVSSTGMVAAFTMVLTGTMVNVAIPDVMGAYGVGQEQAQLMTTAFVVAMTTSQLLNAFVVALFGQRLGFCGTLVLFAIGSLICASSSEFSMIIFGRVLQGMSSGIIQPLVMVTFFQVFPAERRGFAMGIYGMSMVMALALGPTFGGITIDGLSWRYIFFVPLPLITIAFSLGLVFMPSVRRKDRPRFDWLGYLLICITLFCLVSALSNGQKFGWLSDYIAGLLAIAAIGAGAFLWSQSKATDPLLDLSLFRIPAFGAACLIAFIFGMGNFATTYAVPVFGQLVQGLSATAAGVLMMPAGIIVALALPFTGRLADKAKPHYIIMCGLFFFFLGTALLGGADANTPYWNVAFFAMVSRFGMSFIMPAVMSSALKSLPPERLNTGAGAVNFIRQLGGSLGTNFYVVLLALRTQFHSDAYTTTQISGNAASQELLLEVGAILNAAGVPEATHQSGALYYLGQVVHAQASTSGFQDGFIIIACVFLAAMVPAWILGRAQVVRR
ncbi:MAG: Multidrug export protein EmrB [Alphaproteobacteria bacterium MarineAlpha4_Bin2]|nr:MAG: Multidrug export protein EmrB [Alphaproteobacteria bacterium MarineAlpha4_Bin2]